MVAAKVARINYPTSDGRPMAETDIHRELMTDVIQTLQHWYADEPLVYVSGNLLIYYVPGDKRKHVAPDVFVVFGVVKHKRDYYLLWEEGKSPKVVIELTSSSTRSEDVQTKFVIYRDRFKVKEYFLFDPRRDYLEPRLQGFRLVKGQYVPMTPSEGGLFSKVLGLRLIDDNGALRLVNPETGERLPTPREMAERAEQLAQENEQLRQALGQLRGRRGNGKKR